MKSALPCPAWRILGACLIGLVLTGWPAPAAADVADDEYNLAAGWYKRMRWEEAADGFAAFLKAHPKHEKSPLARFYLGLSQLNRKQYTPARDAFRQFVKENPTHRHVNHASYRIGECSYLLDDWKSAEGELTKFLAAAPQDKLAEYARFYLGDVSLRLNKPTEALQQFDAASKQFPQGALAEDNLFGQARAQDALKNSAAAIKLYEQIAANPKGTLVGEALFSLAGRYFEDKQYAPAIAAYARLEKEFPDSVRIPAAHLNHGFALYETKDYAGAEQQFALTAGGKDAKLAPQGAYWQGMSRRSAGDLPGAVELLKGAFEKHQADAWGETILYRWAETEQRRGELASATALYLDVVKRWPKGDYADDSLYAAAAAALEGGKTAECETLLGQFGTQYPQSPLRGHYGVLRGRLEILKGQAAAAVPLFEKVLKESDLPAAQTNARYHLGYALYALRRYAEAVTATDALVAKSPPAGLEDVYVLRGASQLAEAKRLTAGKEKLADADRLLFEKAVTSATSYLDSRAKGPQVDRALAVRAQAAAGAGKKDVAQRDLATLLRDFPQSPELNSTQFDLAGAAYANADFEWAAALYEGLAKVNPPSTFAPRAWSWWGWSLYKKNAFAEAATAFEQAVPVLTAAAAAAQGEPKAELEKLTAEAAFMQGKALQDGQMPAAAIPVYQAAFKKYAPREEAYKSGLQAARLLRDAKQITPADAAYADLAQTFPKDPRHDKLLDEWALVNYEAENFERADEIFRRLIAEAPNSDLVDNAQLSLAESELVNGRVDTARPQFLALTTNPKADAQVKQVAGFHLVEIDVEREAWKDVKASSQQLATSFPEGAYRWFAELHWAEADLQLNDAAGALARLRNVKQQNGTPAVAEAAWFPRVWVLSAEAAFRQKQYAAVAAEVDEFRKWDPQSPYLYLADEVLGRSFKAQAKFPEAREALTRVTKDEHGRLTETAAKSQFLIAETHLLEKDYESAEKAYLQVEILYKFPAWQAPALFQAAACQEQLQRWELALESYESVVKQYPTTDFATMAKAKIPAIKKKAGT